MQKLWTKTYILLVLIGLTAYLCHFMLLTSLSDFTLSIGGTTADAGIVAGAFTLAALAFRPLLGKLLDMRGRRTVMVAGLVIAAAAAAIYPLLSFVPLLVLVRLINGAGFSAFTTSSGTMIADVVPRARLGEGLSYVSIAGTVSTALGPMLGIYLARQSFPLFFLVTAAASLLALGCALLINYEKKNSQPHLLKTRGKFFERSALRFAPAVLFLYLPLDAIMIFQTAYGQERNMQQIGLFFTAHAAAMLISKLTLGRITDRIGPNKIYLPALLVGAISLVMLAFARTDAMMLVAAFIFGIPMGIATPILNSILIRISPRDSLGAANATFLAFGDIGSGLGAMIMGYAILAYGFLAFFLIAAGCFILSILVYVVLLWKKARL